ncbi:MAG: twin-arginine translocase subunit TatC, partial [Candidatus Sumerlaeia bacterium]|nr:twin-arginine translocase subunit TatC [Candidatus Sumerlaeia bacterium]
SGVGKASRVEFYREGNDVLLAEFGPDVPAPLLYLRPMDPFLVRLKAALVFGLFLAMPFLLYQVWAFIEPGLVDRERRVALPLLLAGTVLFPLGAGFAYFMMEIALRFFASFVVADAVMFNDAQAYLSFVLTMMLAFGIVFELPLALVLAMHVGITTPEWLAARRKYIFVFLLVAAALITPTGDPITLMALALPLYALFEISLIVGRMLRQDAEVMDEEADSGIGDDDP